MSYILHFPNFSYCSVIGMLYIHVYIYGEPTVYWTKSEAMGTLRSVLLVRQSTVLLLLKSL